VRLLAELVAPPERAAVLLVICHRADHDEESPVLHETLRLSEATGERGVEIALQPLPKDDAERLAKSLVGGGSSEAARSIAERGDGHPLFMAELARATIRPDRTDGPPPTLLDILWRRVVRLSEGSRALLETVAVAGRPLSAGLCFEAAGLGASGVDALRALRAEQLVVTADGGAIGVFHDRVREAVLAHLSPSQRRDHHQRLAVALEGSNRAAPETLAIHWGGAGEPEKALAYTRIAAEQAEQALAFDRAARLYRDCLDLLPPRSVEAAAIHAELGDALANAGRGSEAAHAYLAAAELVGRKDAVRLNAKAAGELLRSGHVDSSIEVLHRALAELDLPLPATPRAALMSVLRQRVLIRLRGLGFKQRPASEVSERDLTRIDVSWTFAAGFAFTDVIRGFEFQARHLRLALAAGEPGRVARALSLEAGYRFASGTRGGGSAGRTLALAEDLAHRLGDPPHLAGLNTLMAGIGGVCTGKWEVAEDACRRAENVLRDECNGVGWELSSARLFRLLALWQLGRVRDIAERLPAVLREAEDRGDLFAVTSYRTCFTPLLLLAADQPDQAVEEGNRALGRWSQRGFHLQHYFHLFAATLVHLYRGQYATAHRNVVDAWPALESSLLLSAQVKKVGALHWRACAELAQGRVSGDATLVKSALRHAKAIEKERSGWGDGLAQLVRAAAEDALGRPERARASLERAIELLDSAQMHHYAAAARRRLGLVTGRHDLVEAADQTLRALGFANPARMEAMLVPGFARA
jgi:eukaryotic-like serine/threonine-protein kinase